MGRMLMAISATAAAILILASTPLWIPSDGPSTIEQGGRLVLKTEGPPSLIPGEKETFRFILENRGPLPVDLTDTKQYGCYGHVPEVLGPGGAPFPWDNGSVYLQVCTNPWLFPFQTYNISMSWDGLVRDEFGDVTGRAPNGTYTLLVTDLAGMSTTMTFRIGGSPT